MGDPLVYKCPENKYGITTVICSDGGRIPEQYVLHHVDRRQEDN